LCEAKEGPDCEDVQVLFQSRNWINCFEFQMNKAYSKDSNCFFEKKYGDLFDLWKIKDTNLVLKSWLSFEVFDD